MWLDRSDDISLRAPTNFPLQIWEFTGCFLVDICGHHYITVVMTTEIITMDMTTEILTMVMTTERSVRGGQYHSRIRTRRPPGEGETQPLTYNHNHRKDTTLEKLSPTIHV
jgi:hypothetical protein